MTTKHTPGRTTHILSNKDCREAIAAWLAAKGIEARPADVEFSVGLDDDDPFYPSYRVMAIVRVEEA